MFEINIKTTNSLQIAKVMEFTRERGDLWEFTRNCFNYIPEVRFLCNPFHQYSAECPQRTKVSKNKIFQKVDIFVVYLASDASYAKIGAKC